ncbi:hypothetical protein CDL12_22352 [Handroanthus impetiginosus]|uniref:Non-specific serine/threonine protein kinase n=1 Tax=Handroanthus impetiginosus TaxID=429701 RepID=A0A2G9GIM7_9LAMI|nr:hypothetical protein CDL12_22352 [Handroanthus impetiginosus]
MGKNTNTIYFIRSLLFLHLSSLIHCLENNFDESLDAILHDYAFRVMIHQHPHTGTLYNATLPANLAGMKVSAVGLRSRTLWRNGANFSDFIIPPRTLPVPYVKRLLIVYHNLGNWSSLYYCLSGYSFVSPVVGFLVYDASRLISKNLSKIELNTMGKPISIVFQNTTLNRQRSQRRECAYFGGPREVFFSEMSSPNVCYSRSQGHFAIVIPVKKQQKIWPFWIMGFLAGFIGLILVGLAAAVAVRSIVGKRTQEMEKEADEGECLQTYWIASSKMPRAEVTRTQPVLESTALPNPKLSWYA